MPKFAYEIPANAAPRFARPDNSVITLMVTFPHLGETVPFAALPSDPGWEHGEEIYARALAGEFGPVAAYEAPPAPVPAEISRRQCAHEMKARGMISVPEAKAMVKSGDMPAMVAALVAQLPAEGRDDAEIDFAADTYARSNPLLIALMTAQGATSADIDDFFRSAATR